MNISRDWLVESVSLGKGTAFWSSDKGRRAGGFLQIYFSL